nr:hypothetical protein Iba_chr09dCG11160 [Ipomoea batatas]
MVRDESNNLRRNGERKAYPKVRPRRGKCGKAADETGAPNLPTPTLKLKGPLPPAPLLLPILPKNQSSKLPFLRTGPIRRESKRRRELRPRGDVGPIQDGGGGGGFGGAAVSTRGVLQVEPGGWVQALGAAGKHGVVGHRRREGDEIGAGTGLPRLLLPAEGDGDGGVERRR